MRGVLCDGGGEGNDENESEDEDEGEGGAVVCSSSRLLHCEYQYLSIFNISISQYRAFNTPAPTPAPAAAPSSSSQSNLISPHATRGPALPVVRDCQRLLNVQ